MRERLSHSFLSFLLTLTWLISQAQAVPPASIHSYTTQSVLSTGNFYKLGIISAGIYKLDKTFFQNLGLNPENIDPRNIKLYGNGGQMLPQLNSSARPDDLQENAIYVAGETDAKFDKTDYILFYAPGPHCWQVDPGTNKFVHQFNIYSDTAYYFLTVSNVPGKRVRLHPTLTATTNLIDSYPDRIFHEQDLINILQSGRNWYGETFNTITSSRSFTFPLPDLIPGTLVSVTSAVVGNSKTASAFRIKADENNLGTQTFSGTGDHPYHAEGEHKVQTFQIPANNLTSGKLQFNYTYDSQGTPAAVGYLDYVEIMTERRLALVGNQTIFRSRMPNNSANVATYKIANVPTDAQVWDVTNLSRTASFPLQIANNSATFTSKADSLREFVVFKGSDFPKPFPVERVNQQNLHGLNLAGDLDLLILTHPLFKTAAEKLALHRQNHDHLQVAVVTTTEVYNEFSSGSQDITAIRDFMRMLYQRRKKSGDRALYLLLLGDASYDYKSNAQTIKPRTANNTNFVPVYESHESLDPLKTYSSEDYFGLLDDSEGLWREDKFDTPETVDIGIGRLPVKTSSEAESLVQKIIHYDSPASFGKWRNQITLVADDGDNAEHLRDAESLATLLKEKQPGYFLNKIYLDLFKQDNVPNGQRSPTTSREIDKAVEQGSLILNYSGHGNETWLTNEQVITASQIADWRNYNNLPFLLTATCEFGRYDDPRRNSGAEVALLNVQGGAIGLISTTRPVFASSNRVLNRNFMQAAFARVNGEFPCLGDIMRQTKNSSQSNVNNRNFVLLGDPSQRLAYPSLKASITHINNQPVSGSVADTLKALQKVNLAGIISADENLVKGDFDGTIQITVYEKSKQVKTLGDENSPVSEVEVKENTIYNGTATVKAGKWDVNFVVPKDITYNTGLGQVLLYAYNAQSDAHGYSNNLILTGTAAPIKSDNTPPQIKLFFDDTIFVAGGLTGKNTLLLAQLSDENGINTSNTGIGHEITAYLDGNKSEAVILNSFFSYESNNFQAGHLKYAFKDLPLGKHMLTLKAWDTHNNSGEAHLLFNVTDNQELKIANLSNYPNPVQTETYFTFDHNQTGKELETQIHIYDTTGKLVRSIYHHKKITDKSLISLVWDGRDNNQNLLRNGIYLYRISVRCKENGKEAHAVNKLLLLK